MGHTRKRVEPGRYSQRVTAFPRSERQGLCAYHFLNWARLDELLGAATDLLASMAREGR